MRLCAQLLIVLLSACASCAKPAPQLSYQGKATTFLELEEKAFLGSSSIENSLLNVGGEIVAIHDPYFDGSLYKVSLGSNGREFKGNVQVGSDARFTYVFEHAGTFYNFVNRNGSVYLLKSSDLSNWAMINNGQPVLTPQAGTIYASIWNVGVTVDDSGVWHMLAETAPGNPNEFQGGVGLAYSWATMANDQINFNTNRSATHVVARSGNPDLKYISGKGILAVHGSVNDSGTWEVHASTFVGSTWTEHRDFLIGSSGVHVCDPSIVEMANGQTLLSVSVDQNSIYLSQSKESLSQIFDRLTQ